MTEKPIIFALANPIPEIMPADAKDAGAYIVATGRSDFANQVNNALIFPGVLKAALEFPGAQFTNEVFLGAANALANLVTDLNNENIIPSPFNDNVVPAVYNATKEIFRKQVATSTIKTVQ